MDVGQRVLWLLLALLTLALAHERTQARDQCFRLIAPTPEDDGTPYELDEDEYSELGLLFNINCEALPFAERPAGLDAVALAGDVCDRGSNR